jgi:hypothetical protein
MRLLAFLSGGCFALGCVPLLALALFSPGLRSEGFLGLGVFAFGVLTLFALIAAARYRRWFWVLVGLQVVILALALIETFSDAVLYLGT